jgi:membrane-associated protease RseP (regulator of RpoE activity)
VGDILPDPKGSGGEYQIKEIEEQRLRLSDLRGRKSFWIAVGDVVPGRLGWRIAGMPVLRTVEYRYVPTGGPLEAEPRVVELREDRASLEVDIPLTVSSSPQTGTAARATSVPALQSPEAARKFENTLLGRVRVKPTADDSYEINASDLNAALERGVQLLAEAWPRVWPSGSSQLGVSLDIQSPIADGTLGPRGFRVTSPNLAERGGVEVGDVIVGVNGQPVRSFADVYRVYSQVQRDPSLSIIQVDLERQGQHLTKTYRIR